MQAIKNVKINNVPLPHGGHLNSNTFYVSESSKNVQIATDPVNNGLKLSVNDLGDGFHSSDFRYKAWIFVCKGSVTASMSDVDLLVDIGLTTQKLSNGKVVPAFEIKSSSLNIPKKHIHISIHGNVVSKIANAFKGLFMGKIRDEIQK
jgi:hypothetical protein